ncbi:MAG: hypothetical protein Q7W45_09825 [Bacteroidota bacterium]|nr:hypothetical protein [Bacteroidota bacterium]MDP3143771.1 hypothetical protein [Bacteroidota bacterium]
MMKITVYIFLFSAIGFTSCKKNYVCECKNANTTYIAGETESTRSKAKKNCQDLSTSDTKCNIQQ